METQLTTTQWLSLEQPVRSRLAEVFHVPRTSGSHVQDGVVTSDGYTHPDLAHITIPKMQSFLGVGSSEDDFFTLFSQVLDRLNKEERATLVPAKPDEGVKFFLFDDRLYVATEFAAEAPPALLAMATHVIEQRYKGPIVKTTAPTTVTTTAKTVSRGGRPKGSKNKPK